MKKSKVIPGMGLVLSLIVACTSDVVSNSTEVSQPNILLILVDDMGYSDIGSFGGEIETPNLDALAYQGTRLSNFHTATTCSPTRSMLLTGVDHHKAGLGNMLEELSPNQKDRPGYEGYLNNRVVTIATLLRDAGYFTTMSGKWHLGQAEGYRPVDRGFIDAFSLLVGGASHFSDMRPAYAPSPEIKAKYAENGKLLDVLPDDFEYSSQYYVDRMITSLKSRTSSEQPFFGYLSFTAPHWPLQAPAAAIEKYRGKYATGYDVLLQQRLAKSKALGVIPESAKANNAPPAYRPWDQLDASRKQIEERAMEVYAAMIDEVDVQTGRLIKYLKESDQLEDTIIIFMSDNGAEAHDLDETWDSKLFPAIRKVIDETHDFSLDAMGHPGSYVLYGHGWGRAGSPAFSLYKAFPTEGGTRVAAFAWNPKWVATGEIRNELLSVKDITPTLLELAGVQHPGDSYQGNSIEPVTGISMLPVLSGSQVAVDYSKRTLGVELFGKRAMREGDWKIVHMPAPYAGDEWRLYNLETDLSESSNLATTYPEKFKHLLGLWQEYFDENNLILPDWVSGY